jgi:hypothetical protein
MTDGEIEIVASAIFGAMIRAANVPGRPIKDHAGNYQKDKQGNVITETRDQQIARRWSQCANQVREQSRAEARAAIEALDEFRGRR